MKQTSRGALLIAGLAVAMAFCAVLSVQANVIYDFESPTYSGGLLEGQDGWTTSNPTHWYVTDTGLTSPPTGLDGALSAWVEAYGYAFHSIADQTINNNTTISELISVYPNATSGGMFILNNSDLQTYAGVWFNDGGGVLVLNQAADAWAGTGKTWTPNETYKLSYNFDFNNSLVKLTADNLVNANSSFVIDWRPFSNYTGTALTTAQTAAGQIQIGGKYALHDNISVQTVPEPGSVLVIISGLVGIAPMAFRRRK